jgi:WD40 repeat protein
MKHKYCKKCKKPIRRIQSGGLGEQFTLVATHNLEHNSFITSISYSHDSTKILILSRDNIAKIWDSSGNVLRTFNHGVLRSASLSPDGSMIITVSSSGENSKVWNATTGDIIRSFPEIEEIELVAFSPDGTKIMTMAETIVIIWDAQSGNQLHRLDHLEAELSDAIFSPDSTKIGIVSDENVIIWNTLTGNKINTLMVNRGRNLSFSPDNKTVIITSADLSATIWDVHTGNVIHILPNVNILRPVFSPDGSSVATESNTSLIIWNTKTGKERYTILPHTSSKSYGKRMNASFSPDGSTIITSSDKTAKLWNAETGVLIQSLSHKQNVLNALFSPDGTQILTNPRSNTAIIWEESADEKKEYFKGVSESLTTNAFKGTNLGDRKDGIGGIITGYLGDK